jgi:hypothetical protein
MDNDNYHLYVRWNGSSVDSSGIEQEENKYIEFRIIEIGQHDGDGSGLTFQAIHSLPTAYQMNTSNTNSASWLGSDLRSSLSYQVAGTGDITNKGTIARNFDRGFLASIREVTKSTSAGEMSTSFASTSDRLWLLSYKEITGSSQNFVGDEGTQYTYYKNLGVSALSDNQALYRYTRAQHMPHTTTTETSSWWMRSPSLKSTTSFMSVGGASSIGGNPAGISLASASQGVVLAFSL